MAANGSFFVRHLESDGTKPHFTWAGNASSQEEAVGWSQILLDHVHGTLWKEQGAERLKAMTRRVVVETSDRSARYASVRMSTAFRLAATEAARGAPTTITRTPGQRLPCDLTHWVARGLLSSILHTDEAFVRASIDGGAHAQLRTSRGSAIDGYMTKLCVESPGIDHGPDPDCAKRGIARHCVIRGEKPLYLSNATQAAAIMLASFAWTVENGDKIEFGSDVPTQSATLRAATIARSARTIHDAGDHASEWFAALGRHEMAEALNEQAERTRRALHA